MSQFAPVSVSEIPEIIRICFNAKRVPYFVGRPGIAKTAKVSDGAARLARQIGHPFTTKVLHLASMSEVDVRGYLIPQGDQAVFTKPEFWAQVEKNPYGILFLDEFPQATHEVQKAVAPLILEGRIGDYILPPGWMVVLAGNGIEDGAGANTILTHVMNRIFYIPVGPPEVEDWMSWATSAGMPHELVALAGVRPDIVFNDKIPSAPDTPFCTPRSLHAVGDAANAYPGGLVDMVAQPVGQAMIRGAIGDGAYAELAGLVRTTLRLPSFDACMAAPEVAPVPTAPDEQYAMVMLVAVRADAEKHREEAATYITRFPVNIALTGVVSLIRRDPKFMHSRTFGEWARNNRPLVTKMQKYITLV